MKKTKRAKKPNFRNYLKIAAFVLVNIIGLLVAAYLVQSPTFRPSRASEAAEPKVVQNVTGTARRESKVTSSTVKARPSTLYVASVTTKPYREVTSVTGLGLNWVQLKSQCGGREQTGVEMWTATGTPSGDGSITASLKDRAENAVIAVTSFSDVDLADPVSNIYGFNTNGLNGSCERGRDGKKYDLSVMSSQNSLVFGAVATRLRSHSPGSGFKEIMDLQYGSSNGDKAGLALISKFSKSAEGIKISGTLSSDTDWAAAIISVNGTKTASVPQPTPVTGTSTPAPTTPPTGTPDPGQTPNPTAAPTAAPTAPPITSPVKGIWTSPEELRQMPTSGAAWDAVKLAADQLPANPSPNLDNQIDETNVRVLAAAIVYSRTGDVTYKNKVVSALEKVETFTPKGRSLAWARETGAYAMAADLIGYRTPAFEKKMRDMAETYKCSELNRTMLEMMKHRPNNWGHHAFGSLTAIYSYLGDTAKLQEVRDHFVASLTGQKTIAKYGELGWQCDKNNPRWINAANCSISCEGQTINVDGLVGDDMRRGSVTCKPDPKVTGYPWEGLQGMVMGARVLERAGMSVWDVENKAICRAVSALQGGRFGDGWKASGDDVWQLVITDKACGTNWAAEYDAIKWKHGKNTGWPYVVR